RPSGRPGTGHPAAAWPTFDQNAARTGVAPGLPRAGKLGIRWTANLDGAVYGQPLAVGENVIAATENDTVYALSASTGKVTWRRHLGTPVPRSDLHGCGDIFPLGITGTPAYDRATGLVYVVAESTGYTFTLFGLSASDGTVRVDRSFSLRTNRNDPAYDQQRTALTISGGRVYAGFGGLDGDCGTYVGAVAGLPASGTGPQVTFFTPTSREGAVWGTAGPVAGPGGDLWISIGNGAATGPPYDGSDSVDALNPALHRVDFFAPATWADDNDLDLDLGSTQPALAAGNSTFIVGKRGTGYLLDTLSMGGVGGQRAQRRICPAYGAAAVSGPVVYEPCASGGIAAVSVSQAKRRIGVLWRGPAATNGSPVLGGGAVWATGPGNGNGVLYELDPASGHAVDSIPLDADLPHFSSLSLARRTAYVNTMDGVVAVSGA
ncbi:MAG: PQQ-binding-like beta-propeller repeat protein, partial [Nocardiopsaceae bacterium]|nr:PQQ-binding-like beta-propeller repeat protein [Nocardiopsaceae bacterium]